MIKNIIFTIITWILIFLLVEFLCGFIAKNTYVHMDMISNDTAHLSYGYFQPEQKKMILFPGLKPYEVTINSLGLRSVGRGDALLEEDPDDATPEAGILAIMPNPEETQNDTAGPQP